MTPSVLHSSRRSSYCPVFSDKKARGTRCFLLLILSLLIPRGNHSEGAIHNDDG